MRIDKRKRDEKGWIVPECPNKLIYQNKKETKFNITSPKYGILEVIIDTEDWDRIKDKNWWVKRDKESVYYAFTKNKTKIGPKYIGLHRFLMNCLDKKYYIDHINRNTLDNRKENLRPCNKTQNINNSGIRKNNTSGYKGVSWSKAAKKWKVLIRSNNKDIYLGIYFDIKEAALTYNKKAIELFGEFAYLNEV